MLRAMRFRVLTISKFDCRTALRGTGLFSRVKTTSGFAVCDEEVRLHCTVWSPALLLAAKRELWEKKEAD